MRGFSHYMRTVIMSQFMKHFNNTVFAENVAEKLGEMIDETVSVEEAKSSGMLLRVKRDSSADTKKIKKAVIAAMKQMIEDDEEAFEISIVEKYEFEFRIDQVGDELIDSVLDIKKKNREIFIEIDV